MLRGFSRVFADTKNSHSYDLIPESQCTSPRAIPKGENLGGSRRVKVEAPRTWLRAPTHYLVRPQSRHLMIAGMQRERGRATRTINAAALPGVAIEVRQTVLAPLQ